MARVYDASGNGPSAIQGQGISQGMQHASVTIGSTTTVVSAAKPSRNYLLMVNDSTEDMFVNINGAAAVDAEGIRINANGGSFEMSQKNGNLTAMGVQAITASGSMVMLVTESA
tara:strand:- start:78 stop:419 length:342 start_codon:yes stop_codon:yes gene_type:complete